MINSAEIEDTCFPFNTSEEIFPISSIELKEEEEEQKNEQSNKIFKMKFKISKYYLNEKRENETREKRKKI